MSIEGQETSAPIEILSVDYSPLLVQSSAASANFTSQFRPHHCEEQPIVAAPEEVAEPEPTEQDAPDQELQVEHTLADAVDEDPARDAQPAPENSQAASIEERSVRVEELKPITVYPLALVSIFRSAAPSRP